MHLGEGERAEEEREEEEAGDQREREAVAAAPEPGEGEEERGGSASRRPLSPSPNRSGGTAATPTANTIPAMARAPGLRAHTSATASTATAMPEREPVSTRATTRDRRSVASRRIPGVAHAITRAMPFG